MKQNLTWLEKEIKKDEKEIIHNKNKIIKDILKTSKEEITRGPLTLKKDSIWKKILNKLGL
jgi:hypothetical protein